MKKLFAAGTFVLSFFALSLLGDALSFRYESGIRFAVVSESPLWEQSSPHAASAAAELAQTGAFAKQVLLEYPQVEGSFFSSSSEENGNRLHSLWERRFGAAANTNIVRLEARGDHAFETEQIVRAAYNAISGSIDEVYSEGTFRLHLLDHPETVSKFGGRDVMLFFLLAALAAAIVYRFAPDEKPFRGSPLRGDFRSDRSDEIRRRLEADWMQSAHRLGRDMPKQEESISLEHLKPRADVAERSKETAGKTEKAAPPPASRRRVSVSGAAPANLPIAEEDFSEEEKVSSRSEKEVSDSEVSDEEPTNEEYKRRLNELLKGNLV